MAVANFLAMTHKIKKVKACYLRLGNMKLLTKAKVFPQKSTLKEWREWGKAAYKSSASMMRNNSRHPDYDTLEKREAIHNANEAGIGEFAYNWTTEGRAKLASRWGYTEKEIDEARAAWCEGYCASRRWYRREDAKHQTVLDKYAPLFQEAAKVAQAVDVSDIQDGFPCGGAHLYLEYRCKDTDLGKALAHFSDAGTYEYKYRLPIKMPGYGQCVAFDERVCDAVAEFLRAHDVLVNRYSYID